MHRVLGLVDHVFDLARGVVDHVFDLVLRVVELLFRLTGATISLTLGLEVLVAGQSPCGLFDLALHLIRFSTHGYDSSQDRLCSHALDDLLGWRSWQMGKGQHMITLGVVLMLFGLLLAIPILWTVGLILLVAGLVLMLMGRTGRQVGSRAHYW
jgi:hypothetical protein